MNDISAGPSKTKPSLIVGVGASAGGLQAIEQLFKTMPVDTGMSFVVVQHLSPNFKSLMDELLSRWTKIPVSRVEDRMEVEGDRIYLIPPKKEMIISQGQLLLTDKDPNEALTLPIDRFFRSLAQEVGNRAVGVVLSGTGSDGSRGIVDIHESGGLVIAQRVDTAKFDGMPLSAKETGFCDLMLAPEAIPQALIEYARNPSPAALVESFQNVSVEAGGLEKLFELLRDEYDTDFSQYKLNTIVRRTERRMVAKRLSHIDEYAHLLANDKDELQSLYSDLLIGVTRFYRDEDAFEVLANSAVKEIVEKADPSSDIRIWVAGCSTGEEAFTVAILFKEEMERVNKKVNLKFFATDLDKQALEKAGNGIYPVDSFDGMAPELREKYFTLTGDGYQAKTEIRRTIVFAPHNILTDAPFTKLDLITCRNLLIYFQPTAQKKILSLFHFGLKTSGVLMMGASETPGELSDEFSVISSPWKIYRKRRDIRLPADVRIPIAPRAQPVRASGLPTLQGGGDGPVGGLGLITTYDSILEEFMPPSVLVDKAGQILHTFAGAGRFLTNNDGRFSSNILDRVVDDLRIAITTAMRQAAVDDKRVNYANIDLTSEEGIKTFCSLNVIPIQDTVHRFQTYLLQIEEAEGHDDSLEISAPVDASKIPTVRMDALESELRYTKESLQATIEELETSNEELQATNEELVASNEELQSTNEELHSVNEELYTVNSEFQNKINELSVVTRDMDNLLQCTEVHTIFLDKELRIRKFTPNVAQKFNFLPQDIGRRISEFTHNIVCADIVENIEAVIESGESIEEEVKDNDGCWFLMRILPYREQQVEEDGGPDIDGALLTLIDVSKLREVASALEGALKQRDEFLAMLSHELRNPLGAILNALNVLKSSDDSRRESAVSVVHRQASQMSLLLDDLLDVTRVSQGKIHLEKIAFDLREVIEPAIETVQPMIDAREQSLTQNISDTRLPVFGSRTRLIQVLVNLLTNASKYSPTGREINLEATIKGEESILRVADNGVGIKPELLERVFDMFTQSERNLDRSDGGLGVGLTLVKSIVELHAGTISASSEGEGKGSEFVVELPLVEAANNIRSHAPKLDFNSTGRRMVLVEDNSDSAEMLKFLLEDAGYEVSIAYDGKAGLELIESTKPDIAIIDIGLPIMTGYEIAKNIKQNFISGSIFLIALTGYGQKEDREAALEAGFHEHLVKPLDPERLNEVLTSRSAIEREATAK